MNTSFNYIIIYKHIKRSIEFSFPTYLSSLFWYLNSGFEKKIYTNMEKHRIFITCTSSKQMKTENNRGGGDH